MKQAVLLIAAAWCAYGQTCAYQTGKYPNGQVLVYRNGAILRQGPDFAYKVISGVPTITPVAWAPGDNFSTVFSIQIPLTTSAATGSIAYTSFRVWQENWTCPGSAPPPVPDPGVKIIVESGTVSAGVELVGAVPNIEVPIMTNIPGERRYEMVTVCSTTRFLGQSRFQVSIGRPGTNHTELTGVAVPLQNASNDSNCWTARPSVPQFTGPYDLVAYFEVFTMDANNNEIPGDVSKLSQGQMTWEIAYFAGKIGNLDAVGKALGDPVLQCSGSEAHVDPKTGITYTSDCGGMLWAKLPNASIVGVSMVPVGGTWTPR
jgi:hypothetical protein